METAAVFAPGKSRLPWILFSATALIAVGALLYSFRGRSTSPEIRLDIVTPPGSARSSFALSSDGRRIAYVATLDGASRLWVRALDSTSAQPLPGAENALNPFWSPDNRSLGFFADGKMKRVDLAGGQPQTLAAAATLFAQAAWGADGVILFSKDLSSPLFRVSAAGGQVTAATELHAGQTSHRAPRFLPGGRRFVFSTAGADPAIWLGSLDGAEPRRVTAWAPGTDSAGDYLAPGWLVRVRQGVLTAAF